MWNELQQLSKNSPNFILNRWDNPLHNAVATDTQGKLWPSSDEFYHPLNPMFSFFFQANANLDLFKVITLRDGAQSLLDFFMRFPFPKSISVKILVPADLLFLVPEGWRNRVLCYRMETERVTSPTKNYLFYGLVSEASLAWPRFRYHIHEWLEQFDRNAPVSAYFATRNELYDPSWVDRKISFELASIFQKHFKEKINFLTWKDLNGLNTRSDITYVSLDQWNYSTGLCAIDSMMMAKAPQLWGRGTYTGFKGKKIGSWPISFQHSIVVYTPECDDCDFTYFYFHKKTSISTTALPHPIKPELMDLLAKRLKVSGL